MFNPLPFILIIILIASLFKVSFFYYLLYLLFGVYVLTHLWARGALRRVAVLRRFPERVFLGEEFQVNLEVENRSWLPVPWLHLQEHLPLPLAAPGRFRQVTTLGPRQQRQFTYPLAGRFRGYYPLGPFGLASGDVFGFTEEQTKAGGIDYLTVYPKIVPLRELGLPSQTPFGRLRSREPLYEDPARFAGVREYQTGDSLRKVHWSASAHSRQLQVKKFSPAITLETAICLNLNAAEYELRRLDYTSELAIVVAASLASHLSGQHQAVGLFTNGADPLAGATPEAGLPIALLPRYGRDHLLQLLGALARAQVSEGLAFVELLRTIRLRLPWGATVIAVTPQETTPLLDTLTILRRAGFRVVLIVVDRLARTSVLQQRARSLGFTAYGVWREEDLRRPDRSPRPVRSGRIDE